MRDRHLSFCCAGVGSMGKWSVMHVLWTTCLVVVEMSIDKRHALKNLYENISISILP